MILRMLNKMINMKYCSILYIDIYIYIYIYMEENHFLSFRN